MRAQEAKRATGATRMEMPRPRMRTRTLNPSLPHQSQSLPRELLRRRNAWTAMKRLAWPLCDIPVLTSLRQVSGAESSSEPPAKRQKTVTPSKGEKSAAAATSSSPVPPPQSESQPETSGKQGDGEVSSDARSMLLRRGHLSDTSLFGICHP